MKEKKKSNKTIWIGAIVGLVIALLNYAIVVINHQMHIRGSPGITHPYIWFLRGVIGCHEDVCLIIYMYMILLSFPIFILVGAFVGALIRKVKRNYEKPK